VLLVAREKTGVAGDHFSARMTLGRLQDDMAESSLTSQALGRAWHAIGTPGYESGASLQASKDVRIHHQPS
jgi:hypothetical protein